MSQTTTILNAEQIHHKIERLTWELYDRHSRTERLHVVGIKENGYWLANELVVRLRKISPIEVVLHELVIADKDNPDPELMNLDLPEGEELALVDDVLNSGRTLLGAVIKLMSFKPKVLSTTVLVDRSHKRFPVKADLKGLSLSTTLQEHVELIVKDGQAHSVILD